MDQKALMAIREVIQHEFRKMDTSIERLKAISCHLTTNDKEAFDEMFSGLTKR